MVTAAASPRVSVLLPVRDGAGVLSGALDSLSAQSLADHEVVVVDDGSRDGTAELLRRRARSDPRIRVLRQEPEGIVPALERARAHARGPYLARMDADDVAHPERLQRQWELMEECPGVAVCGTRITYFPEEEVAGGARRYARWINALTTPDDHERDVFVECPLPHPTFFLRAAAVEEAGGYRDPGWPEDYDLLLRLWERGGRMAKVPRPLLEWREGPGRLSRTHPRYAPAAFRRCKVHYLKRTLLRGRRSAVVWGAGPTGKAFARALAGEGVEVRAFVDLDPRKIGQEIHGAPVVPPEDVDGFRGSLCVAAVGQPGAREEIRDALRALGWKELEEFVAVA